MGIGRYAGRWFTLRYGMLYAASAVIVVCNRLWLSFWSALCLGLFVLALAALGLLQNMGMALHWLLLLALLAVACWLHRRAGMPFRWPSRAAIEHAMESASGLAHRPLMALRDQPSVSDTTALWQLHRQRMAATLGRITFARPEGSVSLRDPYDLRHVAGLFFACALVIGGAHVPARITQALSPGMPPLPARPVIAVDAWIIPPTYTQAAPVYLARSHNEQAQLTSDPHVPAGSVLKIRLSGPRLRPTVNLNGSSLRVTRIDRRNYTAEATLAGDTTLHIRHGLQRLGSWQIAAASDQKPKIALLDAGSGGNGLLKLTWQAGDDYGLTGLAARITAPQEHATLLGGDITTTLDLPLPQRPEAGQKLDGVFSESIDLSRHPLAGTPVTITLIARDDAGHISHSQDLRVTLPERRLSSAVAQRIVNERKRLFWFPDSWLTRDFTGETLLDIVNTPPLYRGDPRVFLPLVSAIKRLGYDGRSEAVASTRDLLWDIALRIEDGGVSESGRDLQAALADFSAALNDPATPPERLAELLQEVQAKMQDYMRSLAQEMRQRQQMEGKTAQLPPDIANKVMQKIDLNALMENLRAMSSGENRQQLRQMMDALRTAVQNMSVESMARAQQQQQQAMKALQDLAEVARRQQELMEATSATSTDTTGEEWRDMTAEQESLATALRRTQTALGPLAGMMSADLKAAGNLMKLAVDRLSEQQRDNALAAQKGALDALMKAQDSAMQQLADQMQQMMMLGMGSMQPSGGYGEGYDPLGRALGDGKATGGSIGIPSEGARQRVHAIQKELRERYNDTTRPRGERDYIERLLDIFSRP